MPDFSINLVVRQRPYLCRKQHDNRIYTSTRDVIGTRYFGIDRGLHGNEQHVEDPAPNIKD